MAEMLTASNLMFHLIRAVLKWMNFKGGTAPSMLIFALFTCVLVGALFLQVQVVERVTIDNDEIAYVYDSHLVSQFKNPLVSGSARGFGMWYLLAPWTAYFGVDDFYALKLFSVVFTVFAEIILFAIFWQMRKPWLGLLAAVLYAFSPYIVVSGAYLHTQTVQIVFLLLALLAYVRYRQLPEPTKKPHWKNVKTLFLLVSGLALGYAFITRENSVFHVLILSLLIFLTEGLSFKKAAQRTGVLLLGAGSIVLANLLIVSSSVGFSRVLALYQRFTDSSTGVASGFVLKNVMTITSMMHWPYTIDLLLLATFGLWALIALILRSVRPHSIPGSVFQKMSSWQFLSFLVVGLALFLLMATSLNRYNSFLRSDCYADATPDAYCHREIVESTVSTALVGITSIVGLFVLRRRSTNIVNKSVNLETVAMIFLLLPVVLSYLKHLRFTVSYFQEFYPGVIFLAVMGVNLLWQKRMFASLLLLASLLVVGYQASWKNMFEIPMSGSYTFSDIEELKNQINQIFPNQEPKIFTASTAIAHAIGGRSLVNTSHPISYGFSLPEDLKYRLYPHPEVYQAQLMQAGCEGVVLIDLLTKQSYFWKDNPLQLYIENEFKPVYVLSSEERTKILVKKECIDKSLNLPDVSI